MDAGNDKVPNKVPLSNDDDIQPFKDGVIIGIDLGTNTSCVAVWHLDKNRVKIIKTKDNEKTMPSIVRWNSDESSVPVVGSQASKDPPQGSQVISCTKRIMGLSWESSIFNDILPSLPFEACREMDQVGIKIANKVVLPQKVATEILSALRQNAIDWLSRPGHRIFTRMKELRKSVNIPNSKAEVIRCVIGVPVFFNEQQKEATRQSAYDAGFSQVTVMAESTAAALAYGLFVAGRKRVLVFDAGGGTTDVTMMDVDEGEFQTIACAGDNQLGGEDMDTMFALYLLRAHKDAKLLLRDREFRAEVARCREHLSDQTCARFRGVTVTRDELEVAIKPFIGRARQLVQQVVCEEGGGVDEVVLVGGLSHTPALREMLKALFPNLPDLCCSSDAATTVAQGLAIRGAVLGGVSGNVLRSFLMTDVLPLDIGVESFSTQAEEEDAGEEGGQLDVVLPRLTKLPATSSRVFRCASRLQKGITVDVFEGPHNMARRNDKVASFSFSLPSLAKYNKVWKNDTLMNKEDKEDAREVLVEFSMDEAGEFRVRLIDDDYISDVDDGDGKKQLKERAIQREEAHNESILKGVIIVLTVVYLLFRFLIRPRLEYGDLVIDRFESENEL